MLHGSGMKLDRARHVKIVAIILEARIQYFPGVYMSIACSDDAKTVWLKKTLVEIRR